MKKFFGTMSLLLILVSALFLVGCGGSGSGASDVTLTFGTHQSGLPASGIIQDLALEFEEETGIHIDFQIVPDAQWRDLLRVRLNSGEAYDIMNVDADPLSIVSRIDPEENAVPLTNEEWVSRITPIALEGVTVNGEIYGMQFRGPRRLVMHYNREIFDELGLEIPTTFEEFRAISQTILDADIIPVYVAAQSGWQQVVPMTALGSFYQTQHEDLYQRLNTNEMSITEVPEILTVLTQMKEFATLGFYGEHFTSQSAEGAQDAFANREVAMYFADMGWADGLASNFPEMEGQTGIFLAPWADNQTVSVNPTGSALFIGSDSPHIDEAKLFFEFMARPENLEAILENSDMTSLCWIDVPTKENPEFMEYLSAFEEGLMLQIGVSYIDPQFMEIGRDIEAMFLGTMTPEEVVNSIAQRRDELAELAQDPHW